MIATKVVGLAQEGLEAIKDHQAVEAAQEAGLVASIHTPDQLEAAKYIQDAKTRANAWKVGGATVALLGAVGGGVFVAHEINSTARHTIDSVGHFIEGFLPHEAVDIQLKNLMTGLKFPEHLPLEESTGVASTGITQKDSIGFIDYTGSDATVESAVSLALNVPNKYVARKPVQVAITDKNGVTTKEWRLQAIITTNEDENADEPKHTSVHATSTFEYKAAIDKIMNQQAHEGKIRAIGQVLVGSDADTRLKLAANLGPESFAIGCAPVLESVLAQATSQAIKQSFASALAVKNIAGMPQDVKHAIDQMANNPPIVVFERYDGTTIEPSDVRLPLPVLDSKEYVANQLGLDAKHVSIEADPACAMDDHTIRQFAALNAGRN